MFMTPYYEIKEVWKEIFWQIAFLGICVAVYYINGMDLGATLECLLVLMYAHEIEPILFLSSWLKEFDLSVTECPEKTLIPNVTHAI